MQARSADGLSVCDALLAKAIAVIIGVPAQLDVSHNSILLDSILTSKAARTEVAATDLSLAGTRTIDDSVSGVPRG